MDELLGGKALANVLPVPQPKKKRGRPRKEKPPSDIADLLALGVHIVETELLRIRHFQREHPSHPIASNDVKIANDFLKTLVLINKEQEREKDQLLLRVQDGSADLDTIVQTILKDHSPKKKPNEPNPLPSPTPTP